GCGKTSPVSRKVGRNESNRSVRDPDLPAHAVADAAAELPVRAELLALYVPGDREVRAAQRRLAGAEAHRTLPSHQPWRIRSGSIERPRCWNECQENSIEHFFRETQASPPAAGDIAASGGRADGLRRRRGRQLGGH